MSLLPAYFGARKPAPDDFVPPAPLEDESRDAWIVSVDFQEVTL